MTNPELQGPEIELAPSSPEDDLKQEVERLINAPTTHLPEGFFKAAVPLLAIHHELSDKEQPAE